MNDNETLFISSVDYIVFSVTLVLSTAVGFFYAYRDRKRNDIENFHRGNKKINPVAVSVSLSLSILPALTIISVAAEVYTYGTMIIWQVVGLLLGTAAGAHFFLPVFYQMNKISIFEYFQVRFGRIPKILCSLFFLINTILLISFALYAPCLAFEAMTGIPLWIVMAISAFVCMTYTLLGGIKAVIWAETLQFMIIIAGMVCILVEGSKAVGGFWKAWEVATIHKRIEFLNTSFDPRTRHTIWGLSIGVFFIWSKGFGSNQATLQRACSLKTLKTAQFVIWGSLPGTVLIVVLSMLTGVVMFAYYHTCDPVTEGRVVKNDQIFPLMILDVLSGTPGLPGLILACLVSAALSSISSGLSALSAVLIEDFVKPFSCKPLSDRTQLLLSKIAVMGFAIVEFGLAILMSKLTGLLHQLINTIAGLIGGPLLGFFFAAMLFPWTNSRGVCAGMVVSLGFSC